MSEEFIGAGWAFPLRIDGSGSFALVERETAIEASVRLIIGTAYGERPMRPEFGCGIHDYVFAPADVTTAGRIAFEVRTSLERWEPRIEVVDVDVEPDPYEPEKLFVEVRYAIRGSNDPRNLVFPFYVIPGESTSINGDSPVPAMPVAPRGR